MYARTNSAMLLKRKFRRFRRYYGFHSSRQRAKRRNANRDGLEQPVEVGKKHRFGVKPHRKPLTFDAEGMTGVRGFTDSSRIDGQLSIQTPAGIDQGAPTARRSA